MSSSTNKHRNPNFINSEKLHLMRIIAQKFASVLEDKKTDRASIEKKETAWSKITEIFNAISSVSIQRSTVSLKKCYENRKKELRKTLANEKKKIILTGGGPPPSITSKSESDEILISIMNKKTLTGLDNAFDSDADTSGLMTHSINGENDIELVLLNENHSTHGDNASNIEKDLAATSTWKTYVPSSLSNPIDPALAFSSNTLPSSSGNSSINQEYLSTDIKYLKTPSASHTSRRRPTTVVKSLTSSDISKKYDMLLDLRLALIRKQLAHIDTQQELDLRKRNLEIQNLEADLKLKQKMITEANC